MRLRRKATSGTHRIADLAPSIYRAPDSRETYVIDLRVRAPEGAPGDRYFEFARKVVEIGVAAQPCCNFEREWRSVDKFVGIEPGARTSCYIANDIAAGSLRRQPYRSKRLNDLWNIFNGDPMKLNILPCCDIGQVAGVLIGNVCDDVE